MYETVYRRSIPQWVHQGLVLNFAGPDSANLKTAHDLLEGKTHRKSDMIAFKVSFVVNFSFAGLHFEWVKLRVSTVEKPVKVKVPSTENSLKLKVCSVGKSARLKVLSTGKSDKLKVPNSEKSVKIKVFSTESLLNSTPS